MPELADGTLIDGRYNVVCRIGSGGMADVYLAEDRQLGRRVALKLLHRRFAEDPGFVERFRREAQAAAGLQHPNIVSVYDRGAFEDTFYIAMEYLPGRSLKQIIREEAPLRPVRAADIAIQILQAARFAHRHGIIHRDLKPHNVLVDDSGHVKVTDFGIARAGASDMTETGSIMGTAQYLSPEQAQGHAVSAASDLYSVGVVLYEMLTGRVPFDAESAVTIALKHVSEAPTAPTRWHAAIPPELEQIVMWALNKRPADRPQDADQFIAALESAKASLESGRRGERTAAMAAVGAYQATAATALARPHADVLVTEPPALVEEPVAYPLEHEPPRWPWIALIIVALLIAGGVAAFLLTRPQKDIVPGVVGKDLNTASTIVQNAGFDVSTINVPSARRSGTVIRQSPQPGVKANDGSTVSLVVSSGPGNTVVPGVANLSLARAKRAIVAQHLTIGAIVHQNSDTVPSGQVISTQPGAGQSVPVGAPIELFVSSGRAKVAVPDVTGESESDARAALTQAGLKVTSSPQTSSTVQAGDVISETPSAGTRVAPGTTVSLVVASAPTTAQVPDERNQTPAQAASALTQAGFAVQQRNRNVSDPARDGIVLGMDPPPGTTLKKGSTVTIIVGHLKSSSSSSSSSSSTTTTTSTSTTATTP